MGQKINPTGFRLAVMDQTSEAEAGEETPNVDGAEEQTEE